MLFRFIIVAVGFFLWSPKSFFFPSLRYLFGLGFEYFRVWFFCGGVVLVGKDVSFSLFVAHREKKKKKKTFDDDDDDDDETPLFERTIARRRRRRRRRRLFF